MLLVISRVVQGCCVALTPIDWAEIVPVPVEELRIFIPTAYILLSWIRAGFTAELKTTFFSNRFGQYLQTIFSLLDECTVVAVRVFK